MNLVICKDKLTCGAEAAKFGAEKIRKAIAEQGECRIILATGASQFEMLQTLVAEPGIDWTKVTMFHLDEYVGLPESHPASFRKYIKKRFLANLPSPIGAAYFAGLAVGFWRDLGELETIRETQTVFTPKMDKSRRYSLYRGWQEAVDKARDS